MTTIVKRATKGSPLTFAEMDANFDNLNTDKLEKYDDNAVVTDTAGPTTIDQTSSPARIDLTTASTGSFETEAHTLEVQMDFVSTSWFSGVETYGLGNLFVTLHQDTALLGVSPRGHAVIMGAVAGAVTEDRTPYIYPTAAGMTLMHDTASTNDNALFLGSEVPPQDKLTDGITYRLIVSSTLDHESRKWMRYRLFKKQTGQHSEGFFELIRDTGDMLDFNTWADFSKTGIYIAVSGTSGSVPTWSIAFSNMKVSWGPPKPPTTVYRLPRYGTDGYYGMFPTYGGTIGDYQSNITGWTNTTIRDYLKTAFDWGTYLDTNDIKNLASAGSVFSSTQGTRLEELIKPLYALNAFILYHMRQKGW